jgi:hypothetical protein
MGLGHDWYPSRLLGILPVLSGHWVQHIPTQFNFQTNEFILRLRKLLPASSRSG